MRLTLLLTLALAMAVSSQSRAQDTLPEGPGKAGLQESCTQCHDLGTAIAQKRTHDEWVEILDRMVGYGLTLSDPKRAEIQDYLTANLSSKPAQPVTGGTTATPSKP